MTYKIIELSNVLGKKGYIRGPFGSSLLRREMLDSGEFSVYEQSNAINDIREFRFFIDRNKFNELKRFAVRKNDLIISCSGTVGRISKIEVNPYPGIISQALLILRANQEIILPDFLKYFLQSKRGQDELLNAAHGSVQVNIASRDIVEKIPIPCPNIKTQFKICKTLLAFDQKIKLIQKMNKTLEEIAKTLFRSWFLDFDPVRAKVEGRSTGLSKEISDLFPDSFENSELGEIPKGWDIGNICSFSEKITERFKKDDDWSHEKLIDLSRMPSNSISLDSYGNGEELSTSVCKFKKYDFLFGSIRPYFNKAGICPFDGISNTSVFIMRAKNIYDRGFLYFYASSKNTFEKSVQYSGGTKMPAIKWDDFKEFKITIPNTSLRQSFSEIVNPMIDKIIYNIEEQKILMDLRDSLLPKLISGELKITDAEKLIDKVNL